jgi:hypothetical protein
MRPRSHRSPQNRSGATAFRRDHRRTRYRRDHPRAGDIIPEHTRSSARTNRAPDGTPTLVVGRARALGRRLPRQRYVSECSATRSGNSGAPTPPGLCGLPLVTWPTAAFGRNSPPSSDALREGPGKRRVPRLGVQRWHPPNRGRPLDFVLGNWVVRHQPSVPRVCR